MFQVRQVKRTNRVSALHVIFSNDSFRRFSVSKFCNCEKNLGCKISAFEVPPNAQFADLKWFQRGRRGEESGLRGQWSIRVVLESIWGRIQQSDNHTRRSFEVTETILVDRPLWTDFCPSVRPFTVYIRPPIINAMFRRSNLSMTIRWVTWRILKKGWFQKVSSKSSLRMNENGLEKNQSFF